MHQTWITRNVLIQNYMVVNFLLIPVEISCQSRGKESQVSLPVGYILPPFAVARFQNPVILLVKWEEHPEKDIFAFIFLLGILFLIIITLMSSGNPSRRNQGNKIILGPQSSWLVQRTSVMELGV